MTLIPNTYDKKRLAQQILDLGCDNVLLKGGHEETANSNDLFLSHKLTKVLSTPRINSKNTHGTGCTLSAAIASFIAQGFSSLEACEKAKAYLYQAILSAKDKQIGQGHGPVNHFHHLWRYL